MRYAYYSGGKVQEHYDVRYEDTPDGWMPVKKLVAPGRNRTLRWVNRGGGYTSEAREVRSAS